MKRPLLVSILILLATLANAQRIYFVYLQTESGDPFFIRMNDKLYSSSTSGYLILPRLVDSTYSFKLGFPGKNVDLDFTTAINKKDHGYLIKDFGEKGWGLFDLQSLSVQMSTSAMKSSSRSGLQSNVPVNAFTEMLAKATDDPSLRDNAVFASETEKKTDAIQTVQKEDKKPEATDAVVKEQKNMEATKQPEVSKEESKTKTAVKENRVTDVVKNDKGKNGKTGSNIAEAKNEKKPGGLAPTISKEDTPKSKNVDSTAEKADVTKKRVEENNKQQSTGQIQNDKKDAEALNQTTPRSDLAKLSLPDTTQQRVETVKNDVEMKKPEPYKKSRVTKVSGTATTEGFESVFIDEYQNGNKDTVRILIPGQEVPVAKEEKKQDAPQQEMITTDAHKDNTQQNDRKFLDFNSDSSRNAGNNHADAKKEEPKKWSLFNKNKGESPGDNENGTKKESLKDLWPFNKKKTATTDVKGCPGVANNDDFLKLRRRMAAKTNDDGMLDEARKFFKETCFSTEQIKNLSSMFLSNAGKYNFFEVAHGFVSDKENFTSLQSELKDQFYIDQFKANLSN